MHAVFRASHREQLKSPLALPPPLSINRFQVHAYTNSYTGISIGQEHTTITRYTDLHLSCVNVRPAPYPPAAHLYFFSNAFNKRERRMQTGANVREGIEAYALLAWKFGALRGIPTQSYFTGGNV